MSGAIHRAMGRDPKVAVITAAMCEGNKLGKVREEFPERFFDVGNCEGHAVAFAGGLAKAGSSRSSTFTARSCSAATTRSSRKSPAKPAGGVLSRPGRRRRSGRSNPPRRLRQHLDAGLPEHGGDGPRRRARLRRDAGLRAGAAVPHLDPLSEDHRRNARPARLLRGIGPRGSPGVGPRRQHPLFRRPCSRSACGPRRSCATTAWMWG